MKPNLQTPLLISFPLLLLLLSSSVLELDATQVPTLARPGCKDTCGSVSIPFPFGIGAGCFLDSRYEIKCKEAVGESESSKKPFLSMLDIEVMEITIPDGGRTLSTLTIRIPSLKMCGFGTETFGRGIDLRGSPYNFSTEHNVFIMEGCPGTAILINQSKTVMLGCSTVCHPNNSSAIFTNNNYCYGFECCQMSLPCESSVDAPFKSMSYRQAVQFKRSPLQFYEIGIHRQSSSTHPRCLAATLINTDSVDQYIGKLSSTSYPSTVPVLLYWSWLSSHRPDSNPHATCWNDDRNITHCICQIATAGNPYVLNGCQVSIDGKSCEGYYTWKKENS